jgi:hypothetical protein
MVLEQILAQLYAELRRVQEAIVVLERLADNLQKAGPKRANAMKALKLAARERNNRAVVATEEV